MGPVHCVMKQFSDILVLSFIFWNILKMTQKIHLNPDPALADPRFFMNYFSEIKCFVDLYQCTSFALKVALADELLQKNRFFDHFLTLWGGWCNGSFSADPPISIKLSTVSELYRPYMIVLVSLWKPLVSETDWRKSRFLLCKVAVFSRAVE